MANKKVAKYKTHVVPLSEPTREEDERNALAHLSVGNIKAAVDIAGATFVERRLTGG